MKSLFFHLSIILLTALLFSASECTRKELKYKNETLSLSFENINGTIYLKTLALNGKGTVLQTPPQAKSLEELCPLWVIQLEGAEAVNSNQAKFTGWEKDSTVLKLRWLAPLQDIFVEATVTVEDSATLWALSIQSHSGKPFILQTLKYPVIGDFRRETVSMAAPFGMGREYKVAEQVDFDYPYPSIRATMQFLAYYDTGSKDALYIGAHDPSGIQKRIKNRPGSESIPFAREEITLIPARNAVTRWSLPYPMVVRPYQGDWYDAGKIYRQFVAGQKSRVPSQKNWLLNNDLFLLAYLPDDVSNDFTNTNLYIEEVLKALDIDNAAIHLYNWHRHRFDDNYPEYFPPRKGFTDFMAKMKQLNVKVVPYINGRIVDIKMARTDPAYYANASLYSPGRHLTEKYNNNEFIVMCPSTDFWQQKMDDVVAELLGYGVDGVYFDQIGSTASYKCVNEAHGHGIDHTMDINMSSGSRWVEAANRLLDQKTVVATEDNSEAYQADLRLLYGNELADPAGSYRLRPLYSAAYSGRVIMTGFSKNFRSDERHFDGAMYKMSMNFLIGSQLLRMQPKQILDNQRLKEYLKEILHARKKVKKYFIYGEMMRTPGLVTADSTEIYEFNNSMAAQVTFTEPNLLPALWRIQSNYLLAVANYSGVASRGTITLTLPPGSYRRIDHLTGSSEAVEVAGKMEMELSLPARSLKILEFINLNRE